MENLFPNFWHLVGIIEDSFNLCQRSYFNILGEKFRMLKIACYEPYLVCSIWKMSCQLYIFKCLHLKKRGYTVFQFNLNLSDCKAVVFSLIH